jgi:hypothetical protein
MRMISTTTEIPSLAEASSGARQSKLAGITGVAIASLIPAVFWSVVIELVSLWLGTPLSPFAIMIVGGGITLFLFAVCAPLMLRKAAAEPEARRFDPASR